MHPDHNIRTLLLSIICLYAHEPDAVPGSIGELLLITIFDPEGC